MPFLAKWVRPGKVDGRYLLEVSGQREVWNWRPEIPAELLFGESR